MQCSWSSLAPSMAANTCVISSLIDVMVKPSKVGEGGVASDTSSQG